MSENTPSTGHNVPVLSHETYAKQAVSSLRAGDKQVIKGSHNVIEALLIAHQNGVVDGTPIAELYAKRGREFNTNEIMHRIFGLRERREDGSYFVVGGETELAREYAGQPIPEPRRIKAKENERVEKALREQVKRNLVVIALLAQAGGAYHEHERPQGAAMIEDKSGLLQIRADVWHDDDTAKGWIPLDGRAMDDGRPRTLTALQAEARRRLGQKGPGRPRGRRIHTLADNVAYIHHVVGAGAPSDDDMAQLAELLPDLLEVLCSDDGRLDLTRVEQFWQARKAS